MCPLPFPYPLTAVLMWAVVYSSSVYICIGILFAMRIPEHVQPVGRPCGTWMHYAGAKLF